jgi:hypothetical protein
MDMPAEANGGVGIQGGPLWAKTRMDEDAFWRAGRVPIRIGCTRVREIVDARVEPVGYQRAIVRTAGGRYNWELEQRWTLSVLRA